MRVCLALLLAAVALSLALPPELAPWTTGLRGVMFGWCPLLPVLVALCLALSGRLLPAAQSPVPDVDHTGLTVGLLLLLEPLLHLAVLAISASFSTGLGAEAVLPALWSRPVLAPGYAVQLLVFAVLAPVCEEFFFRGRLLPWLMPRLGVAAAVSVTSLIFAVAHGELLQITIALPVGLLLGIMRTKGADLSACMLAHAVHNGLFLVAGPGLIGLPAAPAILLGAGLLLSAFSWYFHLRPRPGQWRRFVLTLTLAALCGWLGTPAWRALCDRLWVSGAHRLCVWWRIDNEPLLARLLAQERSGRLSPARRSALAERLQRQPCQTTPRQTALMALLDPGRARALPSWEDDAYSVFAELATTEPPTPGADVIALKLAGCFPEAFAETGNEWPQHLRRWLPLPQRAEQAAGLVAAASPRDRRLLLAALERAWPGRVVDVLARIPVAQRDPVDLRHARMHGYAE